MTGIVAHTYPEWWLKLTGQVAHWSTDYSIYKLDRLIPKIHDLPNVVYIKWMGEEFIIKK